MTDFRGEYESSFRVGEPEKFELPYPAKWTFPECLPKAEVDAFVLMYPELQGLTFVEQRKRVAKHYYKLNHHKLTKCPPEEREKYYLDEQKIAQDIEAREARDGTGQENYDKSRSGLASVMNGSPSVERSNLIEKNAKGLIAVKRLANIEGQEKRRLEFHEFMSNSAKKFSVIE